jgi:hypothetical protein
MEGQSGWNRWRGDGWSRDHRSDVRVADSGILNVFNRMDWFYIRDYAPLNHFDEGWQHN